MAGGNGSTPDLQAEFETIKQDIASLCQSVAALGELRAKELSEESKDKFRQGIEQVEQHAQNIGARAGRARQEAEVKIAENPLLALLIALGFGVLIGRLFSRD